MRKTLYVGIDPGISGAVARFNPETRELDVRDMPVGKLKINGKNRSRVLEPVLADILRGWHLTHELFALVEQVHAMPKQGVASMFTFGTSYGICTGVLAGVGIPFDTIRPQAWKKAIRVAKGKDAARMLAAKLFPAQAGLFARVKDDGRAEAVLLAVVGSNYIHPTKTIDAPFNP